MEIRAVVFRVIHGIQGHLAAFGNGLCPIAIDAGRGGHVQAFFAVDVLSIVDLDEIAVVFIGVGCAAGAVGLVADDQIEDLEIVVALGLVDNGNGMVGTENHAHVIGVVAFFHLLGQTPGVGGGRVA